MSSVLLIGCAAKRLTVSSTQSITGIRRIGFLRYWGNLVRQQTSPRKLNRVRDGIRGNKESTDELEVKLRKELSDTFIYLDLIAQSLGFSIFDAAIDVWNAKSKELGYPVRL